jgi:hypothetical protein
MIYMQNTSRGIVNGIDYTDYRHHARLVELNIITTYLNFVKEYGVVRSEEFFKGICNLIGVDWTKIQGIIRNADKFIEQGRTNKLRFRQEVIFMGAVWGHHRLYTAKQHLHISHTTLYSFKEQLEPDKYVNEEWLNELANNVIICGIEGYRQEGIRFIEGFFNLVRIIGNVSISKTRI